MTVGAVDLAVVKEMVYLLEDGLPARTLTFPLLLESMAVAFRGLGRPSLHLLQELAWLVLLLGVLLLEVVGHLVRLHLAPDRHVGLGTYDREASSVVVVLLNVPSLWVDLLSLCRASLLVELRQLGPLE